MTNPTDTNQANGLYELYELCKEVYKRTGWDNTHSIILEMVTPGVKGSRRVRDWHNNGDFVIGEQDGAYPLYTSDYLLEKLPPVVQDSYDKKFRHIQMWINGDGEARACYVEPYDKEFRGAYTAESDSMLKALLKLTIALSEAGEL